MKQMLSTMTITAPCPGSPLPSSVLAPSPLPLGSSVSTSVSTARSQSTSAVSRIFEGSAWQASSTWQSWGLYGTVVKSTKGKATDYDVAIRLHLPLAWWFGRHVLRGEVAFSFPGQNTLTLRHPSYFAVARVLYDYHPFFTACADNDVAVVREMLRNGEGRPTDEDTGGDGPLWVRVR
jgi:hypothetical protein